MDVRNSPMLLIVVLFLGTVHITSARVLTPYQIARELSQHGILKHRINDWVCLVMSESSGRTDAVNEINTDGSKDYGLFQINDRYWCGKYGRGGRCNIACRDLLNDNIREAVECAIKIYNEGTNAYGDHLYFESWEGWKKECQGRVLTDYTKCLEVRRCNNDSFLSSCNIF
uniref:lysozyme n=2 Tax=Reticulitermes speratus TaxID=60591 RepID=Q8IAD1_9NEOP|nr:lysozyme [Reticulitermes speratus]